MKSGKKILILKAPQKPKGNLDSLKNDTYAIYSKGLIKNKVVDRADIVYLNKEIENKIIRVNKKIAIYFFNSVKAAEKITRQPHYILFVRGSYSDWQPIIKKVDSKINMFYAADSDFWPRFWDPKKIDIVFVDEKKYGEALRKKYPHLITPILDKAVNEEMFRPKNIKKEYDICYVASFMPWKNHNGLFSAIAKFKEPWKIKTILVGNTFGQDHQAWVLSWKYKIWFKWTGAVGSKKVAEYIQKSKFCVFPSELDANPRSLAESLACGVPILVNSEITGGLHLVNKKTGIKKPLHQFNQGIDYMLKNYKKFQPNNFFKENLTLDKIIQESFIRPISQIKKINPTPKQASEYRGGFLCKVSAPPTNYYSNSPSSPVVTGRCLVTTGYSANNIIKGAGST